MLYGVIFLVLVTNHYGLIFSSFNHQQIRSSKESIRTITRHQYINKFQNIYTDYRVVLIGISQYYTHTGATRDE